MNSASGEVGVWGMIMTICRLLTVCTTVVQYCSVLSVEVSPPKFYKVLATGFPSFPTSKSAKFWSEYETTWFGNPTPSAEFETSTVDIWNTWCLVVCEIARGLAD
jgi:hypothetical protein